MNKVRTSCANTLAELKKTHDELKRRMERRMSELSESEEKYRAIFENITDIIQAFDINGKFIFVNQKWLDLLEYTKKELPNLSIQKIIEKDQLPQYMKIFESLVKGEVFKNIETVFVSKSGKKINVGGNITPYIKDGKFIHAQGIFRDITERKKWENALIQSEDRYRSVVEDQTELICRFKPDGTLTFVNRAYCRYFEKKESELIGKKFRPAMPKKDRELVKKTISQINKKTSAAAYEHKLITPDGDERWIQWTTRALFDKKTNKLTELQTVGRDITKEKEVIRMRSEFVSIASHQLRTPLTGIKWFAQLLMKQNAGTLTKEQMGYLKQIFESNERMINLVNDLLNVSRIETGERFDIKRTSVNLKLLIKEILMDQEEFAKKRKVKIKLSSASQKNLTVKIDKGKMYQVFYNLIDNAIKYSKRDSSITINLKKLSKSVLISIADKGVGIPEAQQKNIFKKFFRADNAVSTEAVGSGLGLYIIKAIINAHHGEIGFESKENKGTTFYVSLPI